MNVYSVFVFAVLAISSVSGIFNPGGKKCGGGNGYGSGAIYVLTNQTESKEISKLDDSTMFIFNNLAVSKQLGNNIFELASLLGISRKLHRTPVIFVHNITYQKMLNRVNRTIPGLIKQFLIINQAVPQKARKEDFNLKCCIFDNTNRLEKINDLFLHLTGLYYQSFKYFSDMREELRGFLKKLSNRFSSLPKSSKNTFINCVHIRRGDFFDVGFHVADANFIKNAMKLISRREHRKFKHMKFVMFGDDLQFMKTLFNNSIISNDKTHKKDSNTTYFISQMSATDDLVYSKYNCDTVFISAAHSTFGWWMGYFSKGNRVYYTDIRFTNDSVYEADELNPMDYYVPHWIPLKLVNKSNIIEITK